MPQDSFTSLRDKDISDLSDSKLPIHKKSSQSDEGREFEQLVMKINKAKIQLNDLQEEIENNKLVRDKSQEQFISEIKVLHKKKDQLLLRVTDLQLLVESLKIMENKVIKSYDTYANEQIGSIAKVAKKSTRIINLKSKELVKKNKFLEQKKKTMDGIYAFMLRFQEFLLRESSQNRSERLSNQEMISKLHKLESELVEKATKLERSIGNAEKYERETEQAFSKAAKEAGNAERDSKVAEIERQEAERIKTLAEAKFKAREEKVTEREDALKIKDIQLKDKEKRLQRVAAELSRK